ncbi:MAG TPA: universal stress protein [Candidatus Saccharimonadales bacterium]|nr:universal stress protein [Candidatus Saccharimonadales bacterium]
MNNNSNMKFTKILVPIDGSKNSMKAVEYGIDIAQIYGCDLIVLHVLFSQSGFAFHTETVTGTITTSSLDDLNNEARQDAERLFDEVKKISERTKIKVITEVVVTVISVVEAILSYAEKEDIDLIVVGSKGRSGWKKLILGSIASGISTYAHCPVLIVK